MFEQLFGSKTRARLIKLFLDNPEKAFYVRQLTRITGAMINSIRRELQILEELGIIYIERDLIEENKKTHNLPESLNTKKFFKLNKKNIFHNELQTIFKKNELVSEKKLTERLSDMDGMFLVVLGGKFIREENAKTDLLLVSVAGRNKNSDIIKELQSQIKKEINYTILKPDEYYLRKDINDKFLHEIINNSRKIILLDKLKEINKQQEYAQ